MWFPMNLSMYFCLSCLLVLLFSNYVQSQEEFYIVDSFNISGELEPYEWHYTRAPPCLIQETLLSVELPLLISSMYLQLDSNVDFETKGIKNRQPSKLPVICFRNGGPPLPDFSDILSEGIESIENLGIAEQCYFVGKTIRIKLTNEQISPGALFIGLFHGIGPIRTQAKMINRGSAYSFTETVIVEGCKNQSMRGRYCNQTGEELVCHQSLLHMLGQSLESIKMDNDFDTRSATCNTVLNDSCHQYLNPKMYSLVVVQPAEQMVISASNFRSNGTLLMKKDEINLMCYARYGAIPTVMTYDYSVALSKTPLVIPLPMVGMWYFIIQTVNKSNELHDLCHSMEWEVLQCPEGKAGPNCTWKRHMLQLVQRYYSDGFFRYMPKHVDEPVELHNLPLEPLLTNASSGKGSDFTWTYFVFNITQDSSGKNIHIDLTANLYINFEVYIRIGGLPSVKDWDYFYINRTRNSDNGSMFKLYDSSERRMNAYLPYPREGLWILGLRHPVLSGNPWPQTIISLSVESCPNQCSGHGTCRSSQYEGYRYYSCKCDGRYGGFDCSIQLVSQAGYMKSSSLIVHKNCSYSSSLLLSPISKLSLRVLLSQKWHVVFLTASNAVAILPAVWALHQKAFADFVVFICSGVASAVYHACDASSWCILSFHVLQFMDFWLSFVAVISTFIYLAVINEAARRTLQMIASIVTALLAVNGPTKSKNIVRVLALGASGLLVGWLIELFSSYKSNSLSLHVRWKPHHMRTWFPRILRALHKRFKWGFVLAGFIAVSLAALSWNLESIETYWLWHSAWHVSIYASAFFFLCSRRTTATTRPNFAAEDATSPAVHQTSH